MYIIITDLDKVIGDFTKKSGARDTAKKLGLSNYVIVKK